MKVISERSLGKMQVYDLSVDNSSHSFVLGNGLIAHNSAFAIMNQPIDSIIPLITVGGVRVTGYTAAWVEEAGGIKVDLLGLNSLNDIDGAIKLIQGDAKCPDVVLNGKLVPGFRVVPDYPINENWYDIWDLPEDQAVFKDICESKTETVFQFNTNAAKQWLETFSHKGDHLLKSFEDIAAFTALDRPGPLDAMVADDKGNERNMLQEYAARAKGEAHIGGNSTLDAMFVKTYGIVVFQEQLQKAFQVLGNTTAVQADEFRVHISKKKMDLVMKDKAIFMPGCIAQVGKEEAERLWSMMETFGQYGFNKSIDGAVILDLVDGAKAIKDVVPGDKIVGVDDNGQPVENEIVALHDHGELEGYEVEFDDGYKMVCSINHKFLTKDGMEPLWKIVKENREILSLERHESQEGGWRGVGSYLESDPS